MSRFIDEADRHQGALLPGTIDEYVSEENPVRAVDAFVCALDMTSLGVTSLTVLADRGYYKGRELLKCEDTGIKALVPKPLTSNSKADGRFDKRDFAYDPAVDEYRCPAGERAVWRFSTVEDDMTLHK